MPDHQLPTAADPQEAREAFLRHRDTALEGYTWEQDGPLAILVQMEGRRATSEVDRYLARLSFLYYPTWPPSATFVNPGTRRYDPKFWPDVDPSVMGATLALHPVYADAPEGLVCNSMFFEYYFWGGHMPGEVVRWDPTRHTFAASLNELRIHLRPPYYRGPQQ